MNRIYLQRSKEIPTAYNLVDQLGKRHGVLTLVHGPSPSFKLQLPDGTVIAGDSAYALLQNTFEFMYYGLL